MDKITGKASMPWLTRQLFSYREFGAQQKKSRRKSKGKGSGRGYSQWCDSVAS